MNISAEHKDINIDNDRFSEVNANYFGFECPLENIDFTNLLNYLQDSDEKFVYWAEPFYEYKFVAFSVIDETKPQDSERYDCLNEFYSSICSFFSNNFPDEIKHLVPLMVGGIKFLENDDADEWSDYSATDFFVPRYILIEYKGKHHLVINIKKDDNGSSTLEKHIQSIGKILDENHLKDEKEISISRINGVGDEEAQWSSKIESILKSIETGEVSKVVLSRRMKFDLSDTPIFSQLVSALERRYPMCYTFIFRSGDSFFFGASPEQLFKYSEGLVESDALAGSVKIGETKEEDEKLINEELYNSKNLAEHKSVVNFVKKSLDIFSEKIILVDKPEVKKLENIQHLWTPVKAKVKEGTSIISVMQKLHPTPAVCGIPVDSAKHIICTLENHQRGLFAGAIGWLNTLGEGEFTVAIRSALYKNNILHVYAGSGIVDGSEALGEFQETSLKFKPILKLFKRSDEKKP